ncbi:ABC-three component system middle component 5 [Mesorhizobium sp. M1163]|uniref:ABC-three component system middle component 5 n=1 Tax=Mesorhizobium sp. M1163 TaxID=2957065 RepID=UPI003334D530
MLVYHPAFDVYHGVFRALLLLEHTPSKSMPTDTLRIVDLYFVFPYLLAELDFPKGAGARGRKLAGTRSRFNTLPSPRAFLTQVKGLHSLVTASLAGQELVSVEALRDGIVSRTDIEIPTGLLIHATAEDNELAEYLGSKVATVPLLGKRGLKDRSDLMEFRYDPA